MCGRFVLTANLDAIQQSFNLTTMTAGMVARYNIAPTQPVAVITNEKPQELTFHKWGLIPSWSKDTAGAAKLINARSETAAEKPSFRAAFRRRRCIIPSDGFYEWQQQGSDRVPLFIHFEGRELFGMAGLWEVWQSTDGGEVRSCTILTTEANDFMKPIHNRMPVILHREDYPLWLSPSEEPIPVLQALMKPYSGENLTAYPVSKAVNRPGNDSPELVERVH
jgi:putative SOS response-associated peptidase YedK